MMQGRLTLAIETSNPTAAAEGSGMSVALGRMSEVGLEPLGEEPVRAGARGRAAGASAIRVSGGSGGEGDDDLVPAIDRLCARTGLGPTDLRGGRVAVAVGPGGYTGLRVACAVGKMIAEGSGAACVAVPTAAVALAGDSHGERVKRAVALASKNDTAWVWVEGEPDASVGRVLCAADVPLLASEGVRALIADAHLPMAMREACVHAGIVVRPPALSAAACLAASAAFPDIDPADLVPIYAREPDAVTQWRARARA
ncbi:MAG: hypothetical protein KF869_02730 [Phycisphaeraceae bacterium]|nr:hypothetical protein [Phycisphaeraceae bacterium]